MFPLTFLVFFPMSSMAVTNIPRSEYDVASGCDVTYGNVLEILTTTRSLTECCGQCRVNSECYSIKYDPDKSICQLNSELYPALNTKCRVRFRYAELTKRPGGLRRINEYCTLSDECLVRNSQCHHNNCQCKLGYSYSPSTERCVESCVAYGSSFTVYRGYRFDGPDDGWLPLANNGADCESACVRQTSYVCRSFEYVRSKRYCIFLRATALTNPEYLKQRSDVDYYHRNCQ